MRSQWRGWPWRGFLVGDSARPGATLHGAVSFAMRSQWQGWPWRGLRVGEASLPSARPRALASVCCACIATRSQWQGWPWRATRVGEALRPGPHVLRLVVANVTSWRASWSGILAANADVYCVQEARIPVDPAVRDGVLAAAGCRGLQLHLSEAVEEQHLLAFAHKRGVGHLRTVAIKGLEPQQASRMQYGVLHLGKHRVLHMVQIYGHADGAVKDEDNAKLIIAAMAWLRSLGDVPSLIVGDFNLVLQGSAVEPLLAMSGWTDVLAPAGVTCLPSNGAPSRIDYVLANRPALAHVAAAGLRWDLGLATHAALELELRVEPMEREWMRQSVGSLAGPACTGWAESRAAATARVVRTHGPALHAALAADDLDAAWNAIEVAAREWLSSRLGHADPVARQYAFARWRSTCPRTTGADGEAQDQAADAALLRLRRLRSLKQAVAHGGFASHSAEAVLAALRRDETEEAWGAVLERVDREFGPLDAHIANAETDYRNAKQAAQGRRRESWHKWVQEALADGGGRLYRWIKADGLTAPAMVPDPASTGDGSDAPVGCRRWLNSLRGGAAAQLRYFEHNWRQLWQRPTQEVGNIEHWLAELDGLPEFPDRVPWTVSFLRALLKRMPKRKAVGLDGWAVAELRLLPEEILGWVVELFEAVERLGRWPDALSRPEGLLLPKPGDGGPMDRRPIWLLPMLYRVWAAGRAQLFARWRLSWGDGDGSVGAEELAWDLALELEAAEAQADTICGSALDWRKAFDHVSLKLLRAVLERARVPQWILGPLMATYSAPRRLRVEGALGQPWGPTSGILPGCALAIFVLSVLVRPWYWRTGRVHDSLRRRVYVDDLTVWARGSADDVAEAVAEALVITRQYEADMDWRLHEVKSKQFANNATVRRWLQRQTPSIGVTTSVRDLGVVATAGTKRQTPVAAARLRAAIGRFGRIRRLPVGFKWRCLMGAAAGTSAGLYGASCGRAPARELEQLRRAARGAACRGLRSAAEIVFGVLSPTWRLDPKAVATLAPICQAVRALRSGRLPPQLWRSTAAAVSAGVGRKAGPVASALHGLNILGLGDDLECWTGVPTAPHGWRPCQHPRQASMDVLLAAWSRSECRKVAARRSDFAHIAQGVDRWATRRVLAAGVLSAEAAGALRSILCGNVVPEGIAAKWNGGDARCPHCGLADEDKEHRFWLCPAWDAQRRAALAAVSSDTPLPLDPAAVRRGLPVGVATTGVLAMPAQLAVLAEAAASDDPQLPAQAQLRPDAPRSTVWSDGGCLHPTDPLLARAAWGLRCEALEQCNFGGPVQGKQTAQRAEVTAVLAASLAVSGPIDLATDSQYVVKSCARIAHGADVREWEHADLWELIAPAVRSRRIVARWVPAHKTATEARRLGLAERDRLGNAAADSNAGAVARRRLPASALVRERAASLAQLEAAQRVMAAAHLAALQASAATRGQPLQRTRRDWGRVRRGTRVRARSAPPAASGRPGAAGRGLRDGRQRERRAAAAPACGLDLAAFFAGTTWQPHAAAQGPGRVTCLRCGSSASTWGALSGTPCDGWAESLPAHAMGLLMHGILRRAGGSAADFCTMARQRLERLPAAPD